MISPPTYEIYAVKYAGPFTRPVAKVFWNSDWEKKININYYIWAVKGHNETLVVDSGVAPLLAQEMELQGYVKDEKGHGPVKLPTAGQKKNKL